MTRNQATRFYLIFALLFLAGVLTGFWIADLHPPHPIWFVVAGGQIATIAALFTVRKR